MTRLLTLLACLMALATPVWAQKSQSIDYYDVSVHTARTVTSDGSVIPVDRSNTVSFDVLVSAGTANVTFRVSGAGAYGWLPLYCTASDSTTPVTETAVSGLFTCNVAGANTVSARLDTCTGCTVSVVARRSTAVLGSSMGGGGGGVSLQGAFAIGKQITGANSEANAVRIGDGLTPMCIYTDATLGPVVKPCTDSNTRTYAWTNFTWCLYDVEGTSCALTFDPDAATPNAIWQFTSPYKPKLSFLVPLNPRGAATGAYESIVSNQPSDYYLTVTDANTDAADFTFAVTGRMDGVTTATFRLIGVSKNATPSGNIDLDCAMTTFLPGTNTFTAHSTTGEVTALLTPATQNRPVAVTTSAHTINSGPLVVGEVVYGSCEVDATATTSAQMTDFRLWGWVLVTLDANSFSD